MDSKWTALLCDAVEQGVALDDRFGTIALEITATFYEKCTSDVTQSAGTLIDAHPTTAVPYTAYVLISFHLPSTSSLTCVLLNEVPIAWLLELQSDNRGISNSAMAKLNVCSIHQFGAQTSKCVKC